MKYCGNCGCELKENSNFCSNCGKTICNSDNNSIVLVCAIVGFLFPIIGAILYYVFKKSNYKAASTANICSWIGFFGYIFIWFVRIMIFYY